MASSAGQDLNFEHEQFLGYDQQATLNGRLHADPEKGNPPIHHT